MPLILHGPRSTLRGVIKLHKSSYVLTITSSDSCTHYYTNFLYRYYQRSTVRNSVIIEANIPQAFLNLFDGKNEGKMIVKV